MIVIAVSLMFFSVSVSSADECHSLAFQPKHIVVLKNDSCTSSFGDHRVLNKQLGVVWLYFDTLLETDKEYNITVHTNESCGTNSLHSEFKYYVCGEKKKCEYDITESSCANVHHIALEYVFSGTYTLSIYDTDKLVFEKSYEINTNFSCFLLNPEQVFIRLDTRAEGDSGVVEIVETNSSFHLKNIHGLVIDHTKYQNLTYLSQKRICSATDDYNCSIVNTNFTCSFHKLPPGDYSFVVWLHGEEFIMCNPNSLWINKSAVPSEICILADNFSIPYPPDVASPSVNLYAILTPIALVLFVLVIGSSVWYLKTKKGTVVKTNPKYEILKYKTTSPQDIKDVLLVYAREGSEFDNVIETFRNVLIGRFPNVYDLYEMDERNNNPREWLEERFRDQTLGIILFLNLSSGYFTGTSESPIYKNPHCYDHFFRYALNLLREDTNRSYSNFYIVQISCLNLTGFEFLNSFTRYYVPNYTELLLKDLKISSSNANIEEFEESCDKYSNKIQNSGYLSEIFVNM